MRTYSGKMAMSRPGPALPASPLQWVFVCDMLHFQVHQSTPLFLPSSKWVLICDVLCFQAHQPTPLFSSPSASKSSFTMCHRSKLPNMVLPLPSLQSVYPCLLCFQAHQPTPPSFFPPVGEFLFMTCHISRFMNPLLLPPLQLVSCRLWHATFPSSSTHSSLFPPSSRWVLIYDVPHFQVHEPVSPSSPPVGEPLFVTGYISKLINPFLPLPFLQSVSPHLWHATFSSSSTCSSFHLPSSQWTVICDMLHFQAP
jgi:hypothetical protein